MLQRWLCRIGVLALVAICATTATAQPKQPTQPARADKPEIQRDPAYSDWEEEREPVFQLNVSPRLLMQGIDKLVDKQFVKLYGLDEFQTEELKQLLHRELPKFLQDHQAELESLATEWLEAASSAEPPSAEYAAQWAARFMPIVDDAEQLMGQVGEGMREFLNDDQQVQLDGYLAAADLATSQVKGTLYEFKEGRFDPEKHWVGNRQARKYGKADVHKLQGHMEQAREQALAYAYDDEQPPLIASDVPVRSNRPDAPGDYQHSGNREAAPRTAPVASGDAAQAPKTGEPTTPAKGKGDAKAATPKHEWEIYVEEFIKRYSLNEEQQQKARQFLSQAMEQRQKHLTHNGQRMEKITKLFESAKTDRQREIAEEAYKDLNTPLDRMFERLKSKLDTLPTRQQRATAATTPMPMPASPASETPKKK